MQIQFNNEAVQLSDTCSLLQLLVQRQMADKKGIAVAVNNEVIPRASWHQFEFGQNSNVVVFTAAQGG